MRIMDAERIAQGLARLYDEGSRIVFWNDPDGEFSESLPEMPDIEILDLSRIGTLQAKVKMELEQPEQKFLVYAPFEEPPLDDDWLLDMRLYSRSFHADKSSMILTELGLLEHSLRNHIAARQKFMANKDRLARLQRLIQKTDKAPDIDLKILAVLTKTDHADFYTILRSLLHAWALEHDGEVDENPSVWEDIEKYGVSEFFWSQVQQAFGYQEEQPSLSNFLLRLFVTDFAARLQGEPPKGLSPLILSKHLVSNVQVFMGQWRDSQASSESYDILSEGVAHKIKIQDHLAQYDFNNLKNVMTFQEVERRIASSLRDYIIERGTSLNVDSISGIITQRLHGYWASSHGKSNSLVYRPAYFALYNALHYGASFLQLKNADTDAFSAQNMHDLYHAYAGRLYKYDQLYRHYWYSEDTARAHIGDILKALNEKIEDVYLNWYMDGLSVAWNRHLDPEMKGEIENWSISGVTNQYDFYNNYVQEILDKGDNRKVFVIISDALRYEAAEEITANLNGTYRIKADIGTQLGVLPSYTSLGMASLLPHNDIEYKASGEVFIDSRPTASLEQRSEILKSVNGVAVKSDDLLKMGKMDGRDFIKPWNVIYIYHNHIDAVGDSASTEDETFQAVAKTVDEISQLVRWVINNLSAVNVLVTADHGFLFRHSKPEATSKTTLKDKSQNAVIAKKRYIIGENLARIEGTFHGLASVTAHAKGSMEFIIPKGNNLFHFSGGARFAHGGAMPQEIVVPVITIRHEKGKERESTRISKVPVSIVLNSPKITTNRFRFQIIQMEPVSERVKEAHVDVGIYDDDVLVTNQERIVFNTPSDDMNDRIKWVSLVLKAGDYNKNRAYYLILRDTDTGIEEQRLQVNIDLAFTNDF